MASENIFFCPHCGMPVDVNHLLGEKCEEVKTANESEVSNG